MMSARAASVGMMMELVRRSAARDWADFDIAERRVMDDDSDESSSSEEFTTLPASSFDIIGARIMVGVDRTGPTLSVNAETPVRGKNRDATLMTRIVMYYVV